MNNGVKSSIGEKLKNGGNNYGSACPIAQGRFPPLA